MWVTYRYALEIGDQVRKGSKGEIIIYVDKLRKTETDNAGEGDGVEIPFKDCCEMCLSGHGLICQKTCADSVAIGPSLRVLHGEAPNLLQTLHCRDVSSPRRTRSQSPIQ